MVINGIVCDMEIIEGETREGARARLEQRFEKELAGPYLPGLNSPGLRIATEANPRFDKDGTLIPDSQGLNLGAWVHETRRGRYEAVQAGGGQVLLTGLVPWDKADIEFVGLLCHCVGMEGLRMLDTVIDVTLIPSM